MSGALNYAKRQQTRFTYADYAKWDDGERWELIDGVPCMMASPVAAHQRVSRELSRIIGNFLVGKTCELFSAPFDVRLNAYTRDDTVVQPDIMVIYDQSKLRNGKSCVGAPDLIIEILSPSTRYMDYLVKQKKYLEAGVREYWIVDPETKAIQQLILSDGIYDIKPFNNGDTIAAHNLPGCKVKLTDIFPDAAAEAAEPEDVEEVAHED